MTDTPPRLDPSGGFRTARLHAEALTPRHLPDLIRMHSDPLHMAMLGGVRDDAWSQAYIDRNLDHWQAHGFGLWMLRSDPQGPVIGRGLLRHLDLAGVDEVEVGYSFAPDQWGRGLATEIAVACLALGRATFGCATIVAVTRPANLASRRVLEKAGLRFERDIVQAGEPCVLYRTAGPVTVLP